MISSTICNCNCNILSIYIFVKLQWIPESVRFLKVNGRHLEMMPILYALQQANLGARARVVCACTDVEHARVHVTPTRPTPVRILIRSQTQTGAPHRAMVYHAGIEQVTATTQYTNPVTQGAPKHPLERTVVEERAKLSDLFVKQYRYPRLSHLPLANTRQPAANIFIVMKI